MWLFSTYDELNTSGWTGVCPLFPFFATTCTPHLALLTMTVMDTDGAAVPTLAHTVLK